MKKLLIVESPAKIKTISKFLGKDFKIMSTVGHIIDLPKKKTGVHINDDTITIDYVVMDKKGPVIADICKQAAKSDEVFLATDPDREGEIIAWHIGEEIKKVIKDKNKIHRITFNEITKPAIVEAIAEQRSVDMDKVAAQQARRVLDRWVGYEVSPILWQKIAKGLSAGRVQSVALKLICEREREIRDFKPEEYWSIHGQFTFNTSKIEAPLTHIGKKKLDIKNKEQADKLVTDIKKHSYIVDSITDKQRIKKPLAPFMTSTLQQTAYNRLNFNVKKTMMVAQNLYEGVPLDNAQNPVALITYMRTDSARISETAIKQARGFINKKYGKDYLPTKPHVFTKKTKAQDAHEAIRPIDVSITPEYAKQFLSRDQARLYELIWKRFVSCQMKAAVYAQRQVVIKGGNYTFKVTGSTLIFDGFLKVYGADEEEKDKKVKIPATLKEKMPLTLSKIDKKQHFTQPAPRYTEASLVKTLEKEGIGRPSTYASILNTIRARQYTELDERKRFIPTELGFKVSDMLKKNLPHIMDTKFTALMEEDLDKIANGQMQRDKLLKEFYEDFAKDLEKFRGVKSKKSIPIDITCPECKEHQLTVRIGKSGEFVGCLGYPECKFTSNFKRKEDGSIELVKAEGPKLLEETCPKCGSQLRQVVGRYGPFIACSGYPKCKYIHQEKASFKCPKDKGDVVKRTWKGKTIWGCKNYPKCKFSIFDDIEEKPCPQCKAPFLVKKFSKTGEIKLQCYDKECGYKEE